MRVELRYLASLGAAVGLGAGLACQYPIPNHCMNHNGDLTCIARGTGTFCNTCIADADGCTSEKPAADCHWVGLDPDDHALGSSSSGVDDTTNVGEEDTTPVVTTTSGSSDSGQECVEHGDCPPDEPLCDEGRCVECTAIEDGDAGCHERDEDRPVCANGRCVQCTAEEVGACPGDDDEKACGDDSLCTSCTEHDHCGLAGCNLFEQACMSEDAVVHVGVDQRFPSLTAALESNELADGGTVVVHGGYYVESLLIDSGRVLVIVAQDGELPVWISSTAAPQLAVVNGTVVLDQMWISGNGQPVPAVRVIDDANGHARVWMDRSRVVNNLGGGVFAEDGEVVIRSSFVGGDVEGVKAVEVRDATMTISYSTILSGAGGGAEALKCTGGNIEAEDSIFLRRNDGTINSPLDCSAALFDRCASEEGVPGVYNVGTFSQDVGGDWFTDLSFGNFALTPQGADIFRNIAVWEPGDPLTDILGSPRPVVPGASDYVGAHIP